MRYVSSISVNQLLYRFSGQIVEKSTFQTLEALAALLAKTVLQDFPMPKVTVKVEKPSALTFVDGAGVEITRTQKLLPQETE